MIFIILFAGVLFYLGRLVGTQVHSHPNSLYTRLILITMRAFETVAFIAAFYFYKSQKNLELLHHQYIFLDFEIIIDGNLLGSIVLVFISLFATIEAGYRFVFKKKYERPFYAFLLLFSLVFYYFLIFIELPKKTFPIGTYDGHLNPKIVKMKKEEEKRLKIENDLNNQTQKENVK